MGRLVGELMVAFCFLRASCRAQPTVATVPQPAAIVKARPLGVSKSCLTKNLLVHRWFMEMN